ncbi:MAG: hypothetical protein ABIP07_00440 [Sphingomicrobium sp.]
MTNVGGTSGATPSPFASLRIIIPLIVAVAVATRIAVWGNPVAHPDDQFYLFAGEQMLQGHWPYVDVWDRKPLGLFLIYAGIAALGGGIVMLNLVATAFAAATALVVRQVGLRFAGPTGATLGALAYLVVIPLIGGQTGQSPLFYNLLIALAAWLLIDAAGAERTATIVKHAMAAMLLCGLSMTVKQVAFVEGIFFGLAFLWLLWRRGLSLARLVVTGAAMVALALLPTALTLAGYALAGPAALDAYVQASFVSIFEKGGWGIKAKLAGFGFFLLHVTPLLVMAIVGALDRRNQRGGDRRDALLIGWIIAAMLGYASVPHFFDHYALPLIAPLCISAATFFDRASGKLWFAALVVTCLILGPSLRFAENRRAMTDYARLEGVVNSARHGGCIYLADGPTRLYSTTGACRLTRYAFPDHLNLYTEAGAVGVDTRIELARVLAARPAVVLTQDSERQKHNPVTDRILHPWLQAHYRQVYRASDDSMPTLQGVRVWQRRDLAR